MGEPKPLASLTSSLLARKGAARPAMRRQPLGGVHQPTGLAHDDLGWNDMGYDVDPVQETAPAPHVDLKPMLTGAMSAAAQQGDTAPPMPAPKPAVVQQQEALAARVVAAAAPREAEAPVAAPPAPPVVAAAPTPVATGLAAVPAAPRRPRAAPGSHGKSAFTLRLDADRHLRLRLASAVNNRSAQTILIDLLDAYLAQQPEIDAMACRLPAARQTSN